MGTRCEMPNSREAHSFIFWLFSVYTIWGLEENEENEQVLLSSSLVLVYTLVKACLFPSIFFKKKSEIAWRIGHWKDSVVLFVPVLFFWWLPLNWGCNDVNFLFLLHSFIYLVLKKSFVFRIGTYYNSNSVRKSQLINLTTLQYVACTFLDLCSQIVSKMRKLFFMTDKWVYLPMQNSFD